MKNIIKTKNIVLFCLIIIITILQISTTAHSQRRSKYRNSYFLPGDAVRIDVLDVLEFQGGGGANLSKLNDDYTIAKDGTIFLPLIGKLKVKGLTQEALVDLLKEKFSPYFKEPFITVTPLIRVTLMGVFIKPGSYRIDPNESLWELIDVAGGPGDDCDLNSIRVERSGKVVISNLLEAFEHGYTLSEIGVRSGDQIIAKAKSHFGIRQIFDYARFGISIVVLYLQIQNMSK